MILDVPSRNSVLVRWVQPLSSTAMGDRGIIDPSQVFIEELGSYMVGSAMI
jgi:hypothetical protein